MYMRNVNIKTRKVKKKVGRPPGRKGRPLQLYALDEFLGRLDEWRARQRPIPSRSEAIRLLLEKVLPKV